MQLRKHKTLKILSMLLSVIMLLPMMPVTVSASSAPVSALNDEYDPIKDPNLASLSIPPYTITPAFDADVTSYSVTVGANVSQIRLICTTVADRANVTVNFMETNNGCDCYLNLDAGPSTTIPILARSSDGSVVKNYTITVNRGSAALSSDATLSALSISQGTLSPAFATGTIGYSARVGNDIESITVTPMVHDSNATVKVNNTTVASGSASGDIPLNVGTNSIRTEIAAQDGTVMVYTIIVTRAQSSDATLSALSISSGTLSPAFAAGTISYTATVGYDVQSITVIPTVHEANATLKVNGATVASGSASDSISLNNGLTSIKTEVKAQDGTIKTYTIAVTREAVALSSDATLSALSILSGTLSPTFAAGTTSYTATVGNDIQSITVTPTVHDTNATVKVNNTTVTSGSASGNIALTVGQNPITTVVTAQDGTIKTYTITVTRAQSSDATLSALSISQGTLSPVFAAGTASYTATVGNNIENITVTPMAHDTNATVKVNGIAVISGNASGNISLAIGSNPIATEVTAQDGTTKTYTITVTREASALSSDADLSDLSISQGTLSPAFEAGTTSYTASVDNDVERITVTPTVHEPNATLKVNGTSVTSGNASGNISLAVGSNPIAIEVTAQNGTTKTYTVVLTRADITPPTVTSVAVTPSTATVQRGGTQTFGAIVGGTNSPAQTVRWSVSGGSNNTNINSSGMLTVAADETANSLTVTATSTVDASRSGTATVTIPQMTTYALIVNANGGTATGSGSYTENSVVSISAGSRSNYTFINWTSNNGGAFANENSANTTFTMPAGATTVTANWNYNGGSSSGGSSSTNPSASKPTEPVTGESKTNATIDSNGNAAVNMTTNNIADAVKAAKDAASKKGVNAGEVTVVINVTSPANSNPNTVTVNLPKTVQDQIISNKIGNVAIVINKPDISIGMTLATITEMNKQANADIQLSTTRTDATKLSAEAKSAIGSRPAFDLKATYASGSKSVTNFGSGTVSVAIPYTLQNGEVAGGLYAVYVDGSGQVNYITNSSYDADAKVLRFSTNHFSVYGIGYKAPVGFTDIANHWAKTDIEFVVNRGLMNGTSNTTFSPDGAMTRGMFVTALGRLAGVDVSSYKTGKFTDVKTDAYYAPYVNWAAEKGIVKGTTTTTFGPEQAINRQEMAVIMSNYASVLGYKVPETRDAVTFADNASIATWAAASVKQIQMAGILNGKNSNMFDPTGTATRGEISAMLHRYVSLIIDKATTEGWTTNDSGSGMYYKSGKALVGAQTISGFAYNFNNYGETTRKTATTGAATTNPALPMSGYTVYTVKKGDNLSKIAAANRCTVNEILALNSIQNPSLIFEGQQIKVPQR